MKPDKQQDMDSKDILKMLQQKIGNLELTVHALMNVMDVDQDELNKEAENIVKEMKEVSDDDIEKEIKERLQDN